MIATSGTPAALAAKAATIKIRNNRIGANGFLNQRCALTPDLESILRTQTVKILLQQNRHIAAFCCGAPIRQQSEAKRTYVAHLTRGVCLARRAEPHRETTRPRALGCCFRS